MRIFPFLLLFLPLTVWSQADPGDGSSGACTGNTITGGAAVYNCTTLTITSGVYNFPANPAPVVRVKVQGNVTIASGVTLNLSGADGLPDATEAQPGALAGPGGEDGGGNNAGPEDAPGTNGGLQGISDAVPTCGGGGGGGGFATAGSAGSPCSGSGLGGAAGAFYDINILFRGGFGGGAGGLGEFGNPLETGTGGGGGGAIWISAGGDITMNGSIDVSGGKGGNGISASGGGGGGSGGAIRIQALGEIVNNANFDLSGGIGGSGNPPGARGGNGAAGIYQFEDADNVIQGVGTGAVGSGSSVTSETLHSSITCGSVKMKGENQAFTMMMGFLLAVILVRIRGRFRRSV